jgi:hypothetical protein
MPHTPKILTAEMRDALKHWRWLEDQLHPVPPVTAPRYSLEWMDQIDTRNQMEALLEVGEERYIERMLRWDRQRIIDKLEREANAEGRQGIIDRLLS